jgi:single-stranded DNA-specific DHH superfamily exonuclease
MDDAKHAVKLLISDEINLEAEEQAYQLNRMNNDRKDLDRSITAHALDMIANDEALQQRKSTVLFPSGLEQGRGGHCRFSAHRNLLSPNNYHDRSRWQTDRQCTFHQRL